MSDNAGVSIHEVAPADTRYENLWVASLVLLVFFTAGVRYWILQDSPVSASLASYQRLPEQLDFSSGQVYRYLLSAAPDVAQRYSAVGFWPAVVELQAEWVPPFAAAILPAAFRQWEWLEYDHGSWVDYWGQDEARDLSFVLRVIDLHSGYHPHPHPGVDYDPEVLTATQIWYHPSGVRTYTGERLPEDGWLWLVTPGDLAWLKQKAIQENQK